MSFESRGPRRPTVSRPRRNWGLIGLVAWYVFCAALGVAWIGVLIWAIISLVGWVTSK